MRFTLSLIIYMTSSQGVNGFRIKTIINLPITLHLLRPFWLLRTSASVHPLPSPVQLRSNNPWSQRVSDIVCVVLHSDPWYCILPTMLCSDGQRVSIREPNCRISLLVKPAQIVQDRELCRYHISSFAVVVLSGLIGVATCMQLYKHCAQSIFMNLGEHVLPDIVHFCCNRYGGSCTI